MELREFLTLKGFLRIPMNKLKTGHYKIKVSINTIVGNFIVDTGASTSCVGLEYSDYFSFSNEVSEIKASGAGATNMETKVARDNLLILGPKELKKIDFILFDLSHINMALSQVEEEYVHGIIGADVLKKTRAVIDYGRNCLYII